MSRRAPLRLLPAAALVTGTTLLGACGGGAITGSGGSAAGSSQTAVASAAPGAAGTSRRAADVLATLAVKGRAPMTGYSRDRYGEGWGDEDHDGCSTREEILQRDLTRKTFSGSGRCKVVASGVLADPYSGRTIPFTRGGETSSAVQIDHVVALADSWQKGAQQWPVARRVAFANDPMNLLAVDGPLNQGKGAGDAATWLPPNRGYRCAYVARQVAVKAKYGVWVTAAEREAISRVLAICPGQPVPTA